MATTVKVVVFRLFIPYALPDAPQSIAMAHTCLFAYVIGKETVAGVSSFPLDNPHCLLHTYRNIFCCWPIGFGTTQKARINRLMIVQDAIKICRRIIFNVPCSTDYIVGICERYRKHCLRCFSGSPRCSSPLYIR